MALRYVIKKRTFGFDKTKAEKYVAQNVITNTVDFRDLCEEITKVGMVPSGAVKFVLDVWGIERSGFFNGREKWAKGFENQRV